MNLIEISILLKMKIYEIILYINKENRVIWIDLGIKIPNITTLMDVMMFKLFKIQIGSLIFDSLLCHGIRAKGLELRCFSSYDFPPNVLLDILYNIVGVSLCYQSCCSLRTF